MVVFDKGFFVMLLRFIVPIAIILIGNVLRKEDTVRKTGWVIFLLGVIELIRQLYDLIVIIRE